MGALARIDPDQAARRARFLALKARSFKLLQRFDPSEPRDEHGRWTDGGGSDSSTSTGTAEGPSAFVSPNVGHLTFAQAQVSLNGARQKLLTEASKDIDSRLGKQPAAAHSVIGAWSDGAENSLMIRMPGWTTSEARVALAMKGHIGDQKSALLFTPDKYGNGFIASFPVKGELGAIHKSLLDSGLKDHTLEPTSGGAVVHVYGDSQATADAIDKAAKDHDAEAQFTAGHGEFIGTGKNDGTDREQRDDAREHYTAIISAAAAGSEFAGRDLGKSWEAIRDHWGGKLSDLEQAQGEQPAGDSGIGASSGEGGRGGARSADEAQRSAAAASAGYPGLAGLPVKPIKLGDRYYVPGPFGKAKAAAEKYMHDAGLPYNPPQQYLKVDPERATRVATEFDKMKHDPDNPAVKASYDALANEVVAQWHAVEGTGLKVEWIKPGQADPYAASPRLAAMDVIDNNHLWVFPTDLGFGSGTSEAEAAKNNNPMLQPTSEIVDGKKLVVNDVFRIVHDYFGHFKEGVGFRADGEENAWRSHAAMFSDLARAALTSETRGQNSWVNYGPYGEANRTASAADTHFAPQKIGLMPEWTEDDGRLDPKKSAAWALIRAAALVHLRDFDEGKHPRDEHGRWTDGGGSDGGGSTDKPSASESSSAAPKVDGYKVTGIKGMPENSVVTDRALASAVERGAFTFEATERPKGQFQSGRRFEITVTAKQPEGIKEYYPRPNDKHPSLYDPRLAKLETFDKDEPILTRTRPVPNEPAKLDIVPLDRKDVIYRGMSAEEFEESSKRGYFESRGDYNIGEEQRGLTYWSSDVTQAQSYANGFAPWQYAATFERPAYVVAVPTPTKTVVNPRLPTEIGVPARVPTSEVIAVWKGEAFDHDPGVFSVNQLSDVNEYQTGTSGGTSNRVVWSRADGGSSAPSTGDKPSDDDKLLVSEKHTPEQIAKWQDQVTTEQNALMVAGKTDSAASDREDHLWRMQWALESYTKEPPSMLDEGRAGLNTALDHEGRLQGAAFTRVNPETNVAAIQGFGALSHAAGVLTLQQVAEKFGGKHPIKGAVFEDDKLKQAMYEAAGFRQVGVDAGIVTFAKGELPPAKPVVETPKPTEQNAVDQATAAVIKVAADLGYDESKITVREDDDPRFELNGQNYHTAGQAYLGGTRNGQIDIWLKNTDPMAVEGLIAHEIEHQKYQAAMNASEKEFKQVMKLPNVYEIMKADGTLRAPYDKQFPNYNDMQIARERPPEDSWKIGDGVSSYSTDWWIANDDGKADTESAMHETLAEMAKAKYTTGKFPEHNGFALLRFRQGTDGSFRPKPSKKEQAVLTKQWRDLYRTVDKIHERLAKQ